MPLVVLRAAKPLKKHKRTSEGGGGEGGGEGGEAYKDMQKEYNEIFDAWNKGDSHNDIYHLILYWLETYKIYIKEQEHVDDLLERMNFDELRDIVEDFMYGSKYKSLRDEIESI